MRSLLTFLCILDLCVAVENLRRREHLSAFLLAVAGALCAYGATL